MKVRLFFIGGFSVTKPPVLLVVMICKNIAGKEIDKMLSVKHPELNSQKSEDDGKFKKRVELLPVQYQAIVELVSGVPKKDICEKLGIARQTLYNWFDNEIFVEEYRKANERVYKMALGKAINKLDKMMDSNDKRTALKAVENILKLNNYLNPRVDITENTNETITVQLLKEEETEDSEV